MASDAPLPPPPPKTPHVVVVGGGFGGLRAARDLDGADVTLTLVDRKNHHTFQPLLYQVATAGLNPADIASPIRSILREQENASVVLGEVERIEPEARAVHLVGEAAPIAYDYLILATGATHSYFGHDEWQPHAPGLKTLEDALEIRRRVLFAYEAAEGEGDAEARRAWMTFVVVGAGPTGVELAGALAEIAHHTLVQDFRRIDPKEARVLLVEGSERVLPTYRPENSAAARAQLEALGVEVLARTRVVGIDADGVDMTDAGGTRSRVEARTVLWAAGVAASPLGSSLGAPLDRAGRVLTEPDLSVPGHPEIFVVGDLAAAPQPGGGFAPGVAPAALQGASVAAKNVLASIAGRPRTPFRYLDKGSLATVGRAAAVAEFRGLTLAGVVAWLGWFFVHVFFLIGFRNRVAVTLGWIWSYVTFGRGARLITGDELPQRLAGPVSLRRPAR